MKHFASGLRMCGALVAAAMVTLLAIPGGARADGPLTLRAAINLGYRANDVVLDERAGFPYAYVATDKGLTILNIADPAHPTLVKQLVTANCNVSCTKGPVAKSQGLAKKGNLVLLAAGASGMQIINVADPPNAFTVSSAIAPMRGTIYHAAFHPTGNAAYSASYSGEVHAFNIANPAAPAWTQTVGVLMWHGGVCDTCVQRMLGETNNGTAYVTGLTATGNILAAVDWGYGSSYYWDSSDPLHLQFLGTHRLKVSMYRIALDFGRDRAYTLGAVTPNAGLINMPISPTINEPASPNPKDHATYCSSFGPKAVPGAAGTAPNCNGADTCVRCGYAPMTMPSGAPLAGDGGGVSYSTNGKYAFYVGGRGGGELAIVNVSLPAPNDVFGSAPKAVSIAPSDPARPGATMGLQLGAAAGLVAKNDVLFVAGGLLGFLVYEFPGLGSSPQ